MAINFKDIQLEPISKIVLSKIQHYRNEYLPTYFKDGINILEPINVVSHPFPIDYELLLNSALETEFARRIGIVRHGSFENIYFSNVRNPLYQDGIPEIINKFNRISESFFFYLDFRFGEKEQFPMFKVKFKANPKTKTANLWSILIPAVYRDYVSGLGEKEVDMNRTFYYGFFASKHSK